MIFRTSVSILFQANFTRWWSELGGGRGGGRDGREGVLGPSFSIIMLIIMKISFHNFQHCVTSERFAGSNF